MEQLMRRHIYLNEIIFSWWIYELSIKSEDGLGILCFETLSGLSVKSIGLYYTHIPPPRYFVCCNNCIDYGRGYGPFGVNNNYTGACTQERKLHLPE